MRRLLGVFLSSALCNVPGRTVRYAVFYTLLRRYKSSSGLSIVELCLVWYIVVFRWFSQSIVFFLTRGSFIARGGWYYFALCY
jgi:hypothetical protein